MIDFIVENYELILKIIMILLEVFAFLVLVFKKHKSSAPLDSVISALPTIICEVEKCIGAGNGAIKKEEVMNIALDLYQRYTGILLKSDSFIANQISKAIEDILSAPQKKGK